VFAFALALYELTLAPTVTLVDSGELILASYTLGVAHPPGFPLYLLLAHLVESVPIGSVAARANFASALFGALAAAALTLAVAEASLAAAILRARAARDQRHRGPRWRPSDAAGASRAESGWLALMPSVVAGLALATSRTLWAYATITEVYTLNTMLVAVFVLLVLRWRRGVVDGKRSDGPLNAGALVFGLALGVHHVTVGLALPALAALVVATEGLAYFRSKRLLVAAAFAFAGLAVYTYLPIAASRLPVMNWGDPQTLERFWWHVSGRQYQSNFTGSFQVREFVRLVIKQFGPSWLPLALALAATGFVAFFRRDRALFWFTVLLVGADVLFVSNYEIAEDKDAYYLPAFVALSIAIGFGVQFAAAAIRATRARAIAAAALLVAVPAVAIFGNLRFDDRSRDHIGRDYVTNILNGIEPGGMLLTLDWQVYSPMLYVREVERERRDVVVISLNLLRRSWYVEALEREYPSVVTGARNEVDAYLDDLRAWEKNPAAYDRDQVLLARINTRFYDMIMALVTSQQQAGPVYVTQEVAAGQDVELLKRLAPTYLPIPSGLVFRLTTDRSFEEPAEPQLLVRGLHDGTLTFDDDDVVKLKVLPAYVTALVQRGNYLATFGLNDRAAVAFQQALALDPSSQEARRGLALTMKKDHR
jgi:hypothetical protein